MLRCALCIAVSVFIASPSLAQNDADEAIAKFFIEYDDFYDESCFRYKGTQWVETPESSDGKFLVWEGMVANSVARKMQYVRQLVSAVDAQADSSPICHEMLTVNGKTLTKNYSLSSEFLLRNKAFEPDFKQDPIISIPILEPHALATLPYMAIFGRGSEFKKHVHTFLTGMKFVKSTTKADIVNGAWISANQVMSISIDFDTKQGELPVYAEYSLNKERKAAHDRFSSITKTKWKKYSEEKYVPKEIVISGVLGERKYEYEFAFDWLPSELWMKKVKDVDLDKISKLQGRGWFDAFNELLEK